MAVPKKKTSITKKKLRHASWQSKILKKLSKKATYVKCDNCGETKLAHRVCTSCGFYAGKQVMQVKSKSKEEIIET